MTEREIVPGLAGVPVTRSSISYIDGQRGILEYRGIPIQELVENSTFLETCYLLIHGALPTKSALKEWSELINQQSAIQPSVINALRALPTSGHPMNAMIAGVVAVGMCETDDEDESHPDSQTGVMGHLIAKAPTLVAAFHRLRQGLEPVAPKEDLDFAANFLWMLNGKKPTEIERKVFDAALIIHADHTLNASTFASRVTGSTLADAYMVVAAGIATLKGPLHGGANEAVLKQLESIGNVEKVRPWMEEKVANKERIMGLGHRVYKVKDPRANVFEKLVEDLFEEQGHSKLYDIAKEVERVGTALLGEKGIYPNVDFFSGLVYDKLGIPHDIFTPIFAIGRIPGWLAHWKEQMGDNRLYRPAQIYSGEHDQKYIPMEDRKEETEG